MNSPHVPGKLPQNPNDVDALFRVALEINRSLDLDEVLSTSLLKIQQVVGGDFGFYLLFHHETVSLELLHAFGLDSQVYHQLQQISSDLFSDSANPMDSHARISFFGLQVRQVLEAEGITNFVQLPLVARDHAIGLLLAGVRQDKVLSPTVLDLLTSIGEQLGMAIEHARLHAAIGKSEQWYRVTLEQSPDGFLEVDRRGLITFANDATCQILEVGREALIGHDIMDFVVEPPAVFAPLVSQLIETGVFHNFEARIRMPSGQSKVVLMSSRTVTDVQGNVVRFQSTLKDITHRKHEQEMLAQRNEELAALNNIATILSHPLEISPALDQVCTQIVSITGMQAVVIYLIDESKQCAYIAAHRGISDQLLHAAYQVGLDDHFVRRVVLEGQSAAFTDVSAYVGSELAGPRAEGYHAGIAVQLVKRDKPLGMLMIGSKVKSGYAPADVELLENIGKQISTAMENAELYKQMQRQVEELNGLAHLSTACVSNLDPQTIASITVEWAQKILDAGVANLCLFEGRELRVHWTHAQHPSASLDDPPAWRDLLEPIVREHSLLLVNDVKTDSDVPTIVRQILEPRGFNALLVVPLTARDNVIGALAVMHSHPHLWSKPEIDLMYMIANQTGTAIANAQLFQDVVTQERKVQAIFDSGLSGLYATDAEGKIVMFNRAAERVTGWTLDEVRGKKWDEVFNPSDADQSQEPLINEALARKRTVFLQDGRFIKTRDGRVIPVAKAVAPLLDDHENVKGAVGAFWDLSREKFAEEEREQFLTQAAHELRSPLTGLLSALQLLDRKGLAPVRRDEMWEIVQSEGERLKKFADEFLDHEAGVTRRQPVELQTFSIATVTRKLIRKFRTAHSNYRYNIRCPKPEPLVLADLDRTEHVLRNLVDNAVSYSAEGTCITITIKTTDDDMVEISVKDQGPGIPLDEQSKLFKRFYRPASKTGWPVYGHGLGLYIAQRMVTDMGGRIWVESECGQGAIFHFTLRRTR